MREAGATTPILHRLLILSIPDRVAPHRQQL
jgi:hypothetical protein